MLNSWQVSVLFIYQHGAVGYMFVPSAWG